MRSLDGYSKRIEAEAKQTDQLNHIFGQYITASVNDPSKYPNKPSLSEEKPQTQSPEQFRQLMKERYGKKE